MALDSARRVFELIDKDGNLFLDRCEFAMFIQIQIPTATEDYIRELFDFLDNDGSGKITWVEFSRTLKEHPELLDSLCPIGAPTGPPARIIVAKKSETPEGQAAPAVETRRLDTEGISQALEIFAFIDSDKSGEISNAEFSEAFKRYSPSHLGSACSIFRMIDLNGDGKLSTDEFLTGISQAKLDRTILDNFLAVVRAERTQAPQSQSQSQSHPKINAAHIPEGEINILRAKDPRMFGNVHVAKWKGATIDAQVVTVNATTKQTLSAQLQRLSETRFNNIASYYGFAIISDTYYITSEAMPCKTINDIVGSTASQKDKVRILTEAALALNYIQQFPDLVHSNLKPTSFGIIQRGFVKLFDFGLSKFIPEESRDYNYTAPEVIQGQSYGPSADTYSFGLIIYDVLVKRHTFPGAYKTGIERAVVSGARPEIPFSVKFKYGPLLESCWDATPSNREHISRIIPKLTALALA